MTGVTQILFVVLLGLSAVSGTPTPNTRRDATCTRRYGGKFTTSGYVPKGGDDYIFPPYYFNSKGEIAYDPKSPSGHADIIADFQMCTPNYAQEPNPDPKDDGIVYGRFYIPSLDKCLAVTNPSGKPPYFLGTAPCPSAADMSTKKSIPFNFVSDETGGEVDMRWVGGTIPGKKQYQGPSPPANYCGGQYYVKAKKASGNHGGFSTLGEPETSSSDDYRVHLYCPFTDNSGKGTGRNSFLVPPYNKTSTP